MVASFRMEVGMAQYTLRMTSQTDVLYSYDGMQEIPRTMLVGHVMYDEQVWELPIGRYWLLRFCAPPHGNVAMYEIEAGLSYCLENPDVSERDLPGVLYRLVTEHFYKARALRKAQE